MSRSQRARPGQGRAGGAVLTVLSIAVLLVFIDNTIVNVALPSLVRELGASPSELQWIVDAYILVFAGLLLAAGSIGDRVGRKATLQAGMSLFIAASLWASFAGSPAELIAARALLGVGGALILPTTLSILTSVFTQPAARSRAIATWSGVSGLAMALGPVAGGLLLARFWWGSIFLVNVPIGLALLVAVQVVVPSSPRRTEVRFDLVGMTLSVVWLVALIWAVIEGPVRGWTGPLVLTAFAAAVIGLAAFVRWEAQTAHPLLDVRVFRDRRFSAASTAVTLAFLGLTGATFLLTQYLQLLQGHSALAAGLRVAPVAFMILVAAALSPWQVRLVGARLVVFAGLSVFAVGMVLLATVPADASYLRVVLALFTIGAGMGSCMAPATESIMAAVPDAQAGVGSAVNDATREIGGALGVALLGSAFSTVYQAQSTDLLREIPLPAAIVESVARSFGAASATASTLPGPLADAVRTAASTAFLAGFRAAVLIGAAIGVAGALVALLFLPRHQSRATTAPVSVALGGD